MWTMLARALVLFLGLTQVAAAAMVRQTLPNGVVAVANFLPGAADKPSVLMLHGFLQTHEFPTLHRLADGLSGEGYTVLAPNLSLGVTLRNQSLACEAIHTHTMEQDGEEIDAWVRWLRKRAKGPIVVLGHSIGSVVLLAYLADRPGAEVSKLIGVSIIEGRMRHGSAEREAILADLKARIARGDRQPVVSQFSFCQKMMATPESLLSYLSWSPDRILRAVRGLRQPATFIMGSRDERLGADWLDRLRRTSARLIVIEGANHFMDGEHEFDLLDTVIRELRGQ